ncbi:MAG: class I SAM-dependent methyltransferase [Cyclobacteriaceae bacterium]
MAKANPLFSAISYLNYRIRAKNDRSIKNAFINEFYKQTIVPGRRSLIPSIENNRNWLLQNSNEFISVDYKNETSKKRLVKQEANSSLSSPKFNAFLSLLTEYLSIQSALETGGSFGINAQYIATKADQVFSIERNASIAAIARSFETKNLKIYNGDIYDVFPKLIQQHGPELIFLDADHSQKAMRFYMEAIRPYLEKVKVIIIHDIYWSREMQSFWRQICENSSFTFTVDIFQAGLLFPNLEGKKQHFTLKF